MRTVKFDIYGNKGTIVTDLLPTIREQLSVANKNAKFVKEKTGFNVPRLYCITPTGRFEIGLFKYIKNAITKLGTPVKYVYSDEFRSRCVPQFPNFDVDLPDLGLPPYDYQEKSVRRMLKFGRGCILIGTGGGKTFIMALFAKTVSEYAPNTKFLIIVPTLQLVEQTYDDFIDYGYDPSDISRWSGEHSYCDSNIIIANTSIMQSKKSDLTFLSKIDVLLVDEVHVLKKSNDINNIINAIPTHNRFGFTGTMPEETVDQWNVIGKISRK